MTLSQHQFQQYANIMSRATHSSDLSDGLDFDMTIARTFRERKGGTAFVSEHQLQMDGMTQTVSVKV